MKAKMKTLNKEKQLLFKSRKIRKERLRERGITLIALVVTIIILLILVGVTLNIALSENGLFDKAKQSTEKTKDVTEDEQVKVAVTDALVAGAGTLSTDNVREGLKSVFGEDKVKDGDTFLGTGPWTFKGERNTYTIDSTGKMSSKPPVKKDILTADYFTESNYGDYITNYGIDVDGDGNAEDDWRIFYIQDYEGEGVKGDTLPAQGRRIFLIASNYVNTNVPAMNGVDEKTKMKPGTDNKEKFVKYWSEDDLPEIVDLYPDDTSSVALFPKLFLFHELRIPLDGETYWDAQKCVYSLLNTDNWRGFTRKGISDYAIGGPTIEMFCRSWNKKHSSEVDLFCESRLDGTYDLAVVPTNQLLPNTKIPNR